MATTLGANFDPICQLWFFSMMQLDKPDFCLTVHHQLGKVI